MVLRCLNILLLSIFSWFSNTDKPVFDNNQETITHFLTTNMVYPWYAKQNCLQGTIKVSFQLSKNGEIFNAHVKDGLGIDLDDEALRLVKLTSHKWKLASNHKENTEIIIPVKFSLENYGCENLTKQQTQNAVTLYQYRQTLEDVVTNYYKNKNAGNANTKNEQQIIQLKADLGFDKELVAEKMADANKMLRQGDKNGACEILHFIKNIGFSDADDLIAENCK